MPRNTPSQPNPADPPEEMTEEREIEAALESAEESLAGLQERVAQIRRDRQRKIELKNRIDEVIPELRRERSRQLQAELKQLQDELDTVELNLESHLFTWGSLKEPFWQAVRFGGLGIAIGWLLKSCAG
jgi:DNA repair exonuclease SbcCD ATPase subunit